jgi:hypothetical protein
MNEPQSKVSRRRVFAGAGAVGALAATAVVVPVVRDGAQPADASRPLPDKGGGYQVTEHVLRYYQTARV